jgi:hypothetical protein
MGQLPAVCSIEDAVRILERTPGVLRAMLEVLGRNQRGGATDHSSMTR